MPQGKPDQERHGPTRGAFFASALPRGAGDVEVRPAHLPREPREERRGSNAAGRAPTNVGEVREVGAQLLLVILPERHLPDAVPRVIRGSPDLIRELLVVGEK